MKFLLPNIIYDEQYNLIMVENRKGKAVVYYYSNYLDFEKELMNMKHAFYTLSTKIIIFITILYILFLGVMAILYKNIIIENSVIKYIFLISNALLIVIFLSKLYRSNIKRKIVLEESNLENFKVDLSIESFMTQYYPNYFSDKKNIYILVFSMLILIIPLFLGSIYMMLSSLNVSILSAGIAMFDFGIVLFIIIGLISRYEQKFYRIRK